jgi:CopG family transcriptional regulator, nickel-responsive regulator
MSDLVRFGVAMDRALLTEFDGRIAARGYENRSEALRDLIRADLTRAAWEGGALVAATLTLVYSPHVRELVLRVVDVEREFSACVLSSMHVLLDRHRCLDVMAVRGRASELMALAGRLGGTKGVLACELTLASVLSERDAPAGSSEG